MLTATTYRSPSRWTRFLIGALGVGVLVSSCTTQRLAPIPDPLPETLEWASTGPRGESFLGLKTRENTSDTMEELAFDAGVYVRAVVENSPAAAAGFRPGDVVLSFEGHATDDPETLEQLVERSAPETEVRLEVQRGDSVFEVSVVLGIEVGADGRSRRLFRKDPARSRAGWRGAEDGVVLACSDPGGPFPRAGIPVGSVVYSIEGEAVLSARALIRALALHAPGSRVEVEFSEGMAGAAAERKTARVRLHDEPTRVTDLSIPILAYYSRDLERDQVSFALLDLWFISLFRYEREGQEKSFRVLRFFRFSSGQGELSE